MEAFCVSLGGYFPTFQIPPCRMGCPRRDKSLATARTGLARRDRAAGLVLEQDLAARRAVPDAPAQRRASFQLHFPCRKRSISLLENGRSLG
jgi:hypothetical protein